MELAIAERAPGFGGFFQDPETRRFVVYSAIEYNDEAVVAAWRDCFRFATGTAEVRRGAYDFRDLYAWRGQIAGAARGLYIISDVDDRNNRVLFGVATEDLQAQLSALVRQLDIPVEAVNISISRGIVPG